SYVLPKEEWSKVGGAIDLESGFHFSTEKTGVSKLEVDTNGDGKLNAKVKGIGGFLTLSDKNSKGERFNYSVRVRNTGSNWEWSTSGVMTGTVRGKKLTLIDQNGNGRFDDFGRDAIVIGKGQAASFLSRIVNIGDSLYEVEVSTDGTNITSEPFAGETARLDVNKNWDGNGTLAAAIFVSKSRDISFDAASAKKGGMLVPTGEYRLTSGYAEKGGESVRIAAGRMPAVDLAANAKHEVQWGGPVTMEFSYRVKGESISVSSDLKFFGNAGEEYHTFQPNAKSPKIMVKDAKTGKLIQSGRFGGC
ncbi:MAG: hypothetical protein ACI841_004829, partial [Planctomycetota bacterium]